jgi:hypothetical protein
MSLTETQTSFITNALNEHSPQNTLQLGLGNLDQTLSTCHTLKNLNNATLTLITPTLMQHSKFSQELKKLKEDALIDLVELIRTPADEVLPDFYFQNSSFDLAIMNDCSQFDQAMVAFYYIDKMLISRGTLIITDADTPVMRKLCRHLLTERSYTINKSINSIKKGPKIARLLRERFNKAPALFTDRIKPFLNAELLLTDEDLGLGCSIIAFTKPAEEGEIEMDFDSLLESIINE